MQEVLNLLDEARDDLGDGPCGRADIGFQPVFAVVDGQREVKPVGDEGGELEAEADDLVNQHRHNQPQHGQGPARVIDATNDEHAREIKALRVWWGNLGHED